MQNIKENIVVINGKIFDLQDAKISVLDRGFLYADAVFEVMVGFYDKVLDVEEHLQRLRTSATFLDIQIPWSDDDLSFEIQSFAQYVNAYKKYIRLVITRGQGSIGLCPSDNLEPNKILYILKAHEESILVYNQGVGLKTFVAPYSMKGPTAKTTDYSYAAAALKQARQQGFFDILFLSEQGEIKESSTANVFFVQRFGQTIQVVTPPAESGILMGITRNKIFTICKTLGIDIIEQKIYMNELAKFDECFLTSTVRGLVPVCQIDTHKFYTMRTHSIFKIINQKFLELIWDKLGFKVNWINGEKII